MKRILRRVFTRATADTRSRFFRDEILHADPIPKLLLMPRTWRGDLQPVLDAYLEQLRPLESGFTTGRVLSAEEVPAMLDLGTQWLGTFRDRMLSAYDAGPGAVEATPVLTHLEQLRAMMGTGDRVAITDSLRRLRRSADRLSRRDDGRQGAFSEGRRIADGLMRSHIGNFSRPQRIADISARNAEFWRHHDTTARLDYSSGRMTWRGGDSAPSDPTAVRDAMHAAAYAATPREQIAALNRAAKLFWHRGEPPRITADFSARMPPPSTIAEMNQRARAFWAGRSS